MVSVRLNGCAAAAVVVWMSCAGVVVGEDWPHWRGSNRDGITSESSGYSGGKWLKDKPEWSMAVGDGASSPLVWEGKVYVMGWRSNKDYVLCVDAGTGKKVWEQSYRCNQYSRHALGDQGFYRGPTGTPELDVKTGLLFTLSIDGDLNCWDTKKGGGRVWGMNLYETYRVPQRPLVMNPRNTRRDYGYTTAPLVWGDWVIVEVGAEEGNLMAFDKRTGKRVWASESKDPAGHTGGLALMKVGGKDCVVVATLHHVLVASLEKGREGKTVAAYEWKTQFGNTIASAAVAGTDVLVTSAYNQKAMSKVRIEEGSAKEVWRIKTYSQVCTPVIHKGNIYWAWRNFQCVDLANGKVKWEGGRWGDPGSCILTSDEKMIVWGGGGTLALVDVGAGVKSYKVLAEKSGLAGAEAWPHVAIADGRIYVKDGRGRLTCFATVGGGKGR